MTGPSIEQLQTVLALVEAKIAALPSTSVDAGYPALRAYLAAADAAVLSLVAEHGAKTRNAEGAQHLNLGGVRASCTHGSAGLLRNWRNAVEKRIFELQAGKR